MLFFFGEEEPPFTLLQPHGCYRVALAANVAPLFQPGTDALFPWATCQHLVLISITDQCSFLTLLNCCSSKLLFLVGHSLLGLHVVLQTTAHTELGLTTSPSQSVCFSFNRHYVTSGIGAKTEGCFDTGEGEGFFSGRYRSPSN